jgi:hypothetical protein
MAPSVLVIERDDEWNPIRFKVPITYWYEEYFLPMISKKDDRAKKYREELFGAGQIETTPALYGDHSFLKDSSITREEFLQLSLHTRAQMIVHHEISGIVDLYKHHKQLMKNKLERQNSGTQDQSSQ